MEIKRNKRNATALKYGVIRPDTGILNLRDLAAMTYEDFKLLLIRYNAISLVYEGRELVLSVEWYDHMKQINFYDAGKGEQLALIA